MIGALTEQGHETILYSDPKKCGQCDFIIVLTSIIAHETEILAIKELQRLKRPILCTGSFARINPQIFIDKGVSVLNAEPETFFIDHDINELDIFQKPQVINVTSKLSLDSMKLPRWDLVLNNYKSSLIFLSFKTVLPIFFSKGCQYSCSSYCTYPLEQGNLFRYRDPQLVKNEIETIYNRLGIRHFLFRDPVFTANREMVLKLCKELTKLEHKIFFAIETHFKVIDEEIIKKLYEVGLRLVYVGVESNSTEVCKDATRYTDSENSQREKIEMMENLGIKVKVMYIMGFPTESEKSFEYSKNIALSLNATYLQLNVFTPYPGTKFYEKMKNQIIQSKLEEYNQSNLVFKHPYYTNQSLKKEINSFYRQYYLRPTWFIHYLKLLFIRLKYLIANFNINL